MPAVKCNVCDPDRAPRSAKWLAFCFAENSHGYNRLKVNKSHKATVQLSVEDKEKDKAHRTFIQ